MLCDLQKEKNHGMFIEALELMGNRVFVPVTSFPELCVPASVRSAVEADKVRRQAAEQEVQQHQQQQQVEAEEQQEVGDEEEEELPRQEQSGSAAVASE